VSTHPFNDATAQAPHPRPTIPFEAAIAGEIASRFVEWAEVRSRPEVEKYVRRMAGLLNDPSGPAGFWIYTRLVTGDLTAITMSYSEIGDAGSRSKQAVQQELERALATIHNHYPELQKAITELRRIANHW
jgi:hypothetical protein